MNEVSSKGQSHTRQNPLPDDGVYEAAFTEVDAFTTEGKEDSEFAGRKMVNVRMSFQVTDGPNKGRLLQRTFWGSSERDQGTLFDYVTVLTGGKKPSTTKEAVLMLDGVEGTKARLKVRSWSSKSGTPGKSLDILG